MTSTPDRLGAFFRTWPDTALVEIIEAKGSTPREKGAWMLVSPGAIFGTVGGGQMEFMAIERAREMLGERAKEERSREVPNVGAASHPPFGHLLPVNGEKVSETLRPATFSPFTGRRARQGDEEWREARVSRLVLDIPLGPEIGQCCGGRVEIAIGHVDTKLRDSLVEAAKAEDMRRPHVYLFGGGHVGHALGAALALLPVRTILVETRAAALEDSPAAIETRLMPVPEEAIRAAPAGSSFLILTHDHALDFLLVAEALVRSDAAYVGMIGSKTKKATFRNWYLRTAGGSEAALARLVTPIGGDGVDDKRPAVIAALAAAEVIRALAER